MRRVTLPKQETLSRVLVVGCGSIGQRHARTLARLNVNEILAFDPHKERVAAVVEASGARACATLEEAYRRRPHAALICAPTALHLELARQALDHDCHLFIEKPISAVREGVAALLADAEARGRIVMVGYHLRFEELLRHLHSWLRDGRIGRAVSARLHFGSFLPWRHPWEDYRDGYGARRALGGGVILDASHEIDSALWLFGSPTHVYCHAGRFGDLEIDVEDVAEIIFAYPDRVVSLHLDYLQRPHRRWIEVIGTQGQICGDLVKRTLRLYDGKARRWRGYKSTSAAEDAYVRELEHFLDCVAEGGRPLSDGQTALRALVLAEAAKKSTRMDGPIPVDLDNLPLGAGSG